MIPLKHSDLKFSHNLTRLAQICQLAGASASTVIYSEGRVVVFYKDPQILEFRHPEFFDELHIDHAKNACILIAVFPDETV